jgi:hypothetical protein
MSKFNPAAHIEMDRKKQATRTCDNKDANLRQQECERSLKIGGQPILRFDALCNKRPEKRGHSFLQTMAPIQATGGVTPVAACYQKSHGAFSL